MKPLLLLWLALCLNVQAATTYVFTKRVDGTSTVPESVTSAVSSVFGLDGSGGLVMVANTTWDASGSAAAAQAHAVQRANHTGTQAHTTITGLGAFATGTDAANLTGTLAAARIADGSLSFAKTANLQTTLDGKASLAGATFTGDVVVGPYSLSPETGAVFNGGLNFGSGASFVFDPAASASLRTAAGLAIGSNVQAYDADLTTWAGITPSASVQSALPNATNGAGGLLTYGSAPIDAGTTGTLPVSRGGTGTTTGSITGTGALTFATASNGNLNLSPHGTGVVTTPTLVAGGPTSNAFVTEFGSRNFLSFFDSTVNTGYAFVLSRSSGNAADAANFIFTRSRSGGAVQNGDSVGILGAMPWSGSAGYYSAAISFVADGTVTGSSVPTAFVVATGSGNSSRTERLRVSSGGVVSVTGNLTASGTITGTEQGSEPAAPAANGFVLFAVDDGSGKTVLKVKFATGAAQTIATQP